MDIWSEVIFLLQNSWHNGTQLYMSVGYTAGDFCCCCSLFVERFGEKAEQNWWNEREFNCNATPPPTDHRQAWGKKNPRRTDTHDRRKLYANSEKHTRCVRHTRDQTNNLAVYIVSILFVICFSLRSSQFSAFESFASSFVLLFLFLFFCCCYFWFYFFVIVRFFFRHLLWPVSVQSVLVVHLFIVQK